MGSPWQKTLANDIYPTYQPQGQSFIDLPCDKVEFTVSLVGNINQVLSVLQSDFRGYDMQVRMVGPNSITITGYPPDDAFGEQDVLVIVQQRDPGAAMVSSRTLQMFP